MQQFSTCAGVLLWSRLVMNRSSRDKNADVIMCTGPSTALIKLLTGTMLRKCVFIAKEIIILIFVSPLYDEGAAIA